MQEFQRELLDESKQKEEERMKAWSDASEVVKVYYEELTRRWKEEIDTLLVYVGCCDAY